MPDIRRLFSEEDVKEAVDAIDNDDESDFEKHPYRIFVAMMVSGILHFRNGEKNMARFVIEKKSQMNFQPCKTKDSSPHFFYLFY